MTRIAMTAKFTGKCNYCLKPIMKGTQMFYDPDHKAAWHPACKAKPWRQIVGPREMGLSMR